MTSKTETEFQAPTTYQPYIHQLKALAAMHGQELPDDICFEFASLYDLEEWFVKEAYNLFV